MNVTLVHGKYFNSWEALGCGLLGAYIKKHCPDVQVNFFQGCFDSNIEILEGCRGSDIVFFSATTPTALWCQRIAQQLKQNNTVHTVIGGYHASALGKEALVDGIDQVVVGEGEQACVDIIHGNREPVIVAEPLPFSEVVWADRLLIKNHRNIEVAFKDTGKRITSFQATRSCPFLCKFCLDGAMNVMSNGSKPFVRIRDPLDLLDEMQSVTDQYKLDLIKFSDPTWNISRERVKAFCRAKIERGFKTPFYPNLHANVVDDEMFELLAEANCHQVAFGMESGSPRILKKIGKGTTLESIKQAVLLAKRYKIKVRGYFILGMPDEDIGDVRMTEQLADEVDIDEYGFTILCPYPGTQMYQEYMDELKNVDWEKADEYTNDFWHTKYLRNGRLKELQKRLTDKYKQRLTWHNRKIGS